MFLNKPEKPEDITVEVRSGSLYLSDGHIITKREIGLYCKGRFIHGYETEPEAEAARLQYLHDNGIKSTEDFTL